MPHHHAPPRLPRSRRPGRAWRICAAVLACAAVVTPAGQSPQEEPRGQPTFRAGANLVRVDLFPTIDEEPVLDLRPEEVQVFEDGTLQQIEQFEHVRIPPGGPEALRVEPNSIRAGRQAAADPRARVFVVFLDTYHMDVQVAQQLRTPIRRFFEEALGPEDLVAVVTAETPIDGLTFTRRTTVLSGILGETGEWLQRDATAVRFDPVEQLYERCYGPESLVSREMIARRRERLALDALEQLSAYLGVLREERKTVLLVSKGWEIFAESALLQRSPFQGRVPSPDSLLRGGRGRDGTNPGFDEASIRQCESDRLSLAALDHRGRLQRITGIANRSNVSFYPLSPLRVESTLDMLANLRGLAEDTDGLAAVNTNNFAEPMQRIIADTSSYYLLAYQSTNGALDGRFRRITVRVTRPGVQVRARRGYRALSAAELPAPADAATPAGPRVESAVASALTRMASVAGPLPFRLRASSWTEASSGGATGRLWIVGELDAERRREPAWTAGATGELTLVAADGTPVASRPLEVTKGQGTFLVGAAEIGTLAPGEYQLRVRLRAEGAADGPLTDSVRITVPPPSAVGEPVLRRRGPQTGLAYVETADARFRRTERLRLELPAVSGGTAATARLLDRTGSPLQVPATVTTREDESGRFQWIVVDATLAPFAPGDYLIEVTRDGVPALVAFRIVQ